MEIRPGSSSHSNQTNFMTSIIPFIARLADQAPSLVASSHTPSPAALELFRSCTRRHVISALRMLKEHGANLERLADEDGFDPLGESGSGDSGSDATEKIWESIQRDCRAMFLTEILGRLWCGVLEARGRKPGSDPLICNVARYVLLQHLELRREILNLMNRWCTEAYPQVAALDFQYRRMERWTDVLLGPLVKRHRLQDFVFDPERAMEYSIDENLPGKSGVVGRLPRKLAIEGFLKSYRGFLADHRLLREHQSGMIRSILGMLPDDSIFSEERYLLGRIWAENELSRFTAGRRINIAGA